MAKPKGFFPSKAADRDAEGLIVHKNGSVGGLRRDFRRYELAIFSGRIPCPFKVEFRNTRFAPPYRGKDGPVLDVLEEGKVVRRIPIPLTVEGRPKIRLFD